MDLFAYILNPLRISLDGSPYLLDDARPANAKQQGLILIVMDAIQRDLMPTTLRVLMDKVTYLEWDRLDDEQSWAQLVQSLQRIKAQQEV